MYQPLGCPRIVNGTLIEVSDEEEEQEEDEKENIEEIPKIVDNRYSEQASRFGNQVNRYNEPVNRYNPNDRYNQRFKDSLSRDYQRVRNGHQPEVRRRPFDELEKEGKEDVDEGEDDEKAEVNFIKCL